MPRDLPEYRASRLTELIQRVRQARLELERAENLVIIEQMEFYLALEERTDVTAVIGDIVPVNLAREVATMEYEQAMADLATYFDD
jgi:hypothetical protein